MAPVSMHRTTRPGHQPAIMETNACMTQSSVEHVRFAGWLVLHCDPRQRPILTQAFVGRRQHAVTCMASRAIMWPGSRQTAGLYGGGSGREAHKFNGRQTLQAMR